MEAVVTFGGARQGQVGAVGDFGFHVIMTLAKMALHSSDTCSHKWIKELACTLPHLTLKKVDSDAKISMLSEVQQTRHVHSMALSLHAPAYFQSTKRIRNQLLKMTKSPVDMLTGNRRLQKRLLLDLHFSSLTEIESFPGRQHHHGSRLIIS